MLHVREAARRGPLVDKDEIVGARSGDPGRRSVGIDFLRAFSILWIVGLWHVADYLPELAHARNGVTYRATVALLGVFVLVSGYLMGRKQIPLQARSLRDFYLKRFGRIYPPFLAACLLFGVFKLSTPLPLIKAALLIAMLWGPPPYTLWFIAMITLFYAVTPLLLAVRYNGTLFLAVVTGSTTFAAVAAELSNDSVSPRLAMYLPAYCAGLWLAAGALSWKKLSVIGLVGMLPALAISFCPDGQGIENSVWSMPWALAASIALFGGVMLLDHRLPRWAWVLFVAQASYFLYLLHRPVYALFLKAYDPADWPGRAAYLVLFALPVAIFLGWIGQRIYDRMWQRMMDHGRRP